jgi:hypothetical protein
MSSPPNPHRQHDPNDVMVLGRELDQHGQSHQLLGLPAEVLTRHVLIAGTTGAGKSTTATTAITTAQSITDGPTFVIDPKGDGWPRELARAHYKHHGTLTNLEYFDMTAFLPALSLFDIRPDMAAGLDRMQAVLSVRDQFMRILDLVREDDRQAIRSPDVIEYLVTALFDPVHGDDVYGIDDLIAALTRLRDDRTTPAVSTDWTATLMESLTAGDRQSFQRILQGALTRVEKLSANGYLRPLFTHTPEDPTNAVRFDQWLDANTLVVFDLGGLSDRSQRVLSAVLLVELKRALERRHYTTPPDADLPTALLFIDEIAHLAVEELLIPLLSMGRGYGLGVVPMLQYPRQLAQRNDRAYHELLNNTNSHLVGRIPRDTELADRLSGSHMSTAELENRLGNLDDRQWLFNPATPRDITPIRTHLIQEAPLPPGHPDGEWPLDATQAAAFEQALAACKTTTNDRYGIPYDDYSVPEVPPDRQTEDDIVAAVEATDYQTTLPLVENLPDPITFDFDEHAVACATCGQTHPPTPDGLINALDCHGNLDSIDRDDPPPVTFDLPLRKNEVRNCQLSVRELAAIQLVANTRRFAFDRRLFDPVHDPLQDMLAQHGIEKAMLDRLIEDGWLTRSKLHRYVFYALTPQARDLLGLTNEYGTDWGHGEGDMHESTLHVVMVEALAQLLRTTATDPEATPVDAAIDHVVKYYEPTDAELDRYDLDPRTRFDVVGRSQDGTITAIGEAERDNHDSAVAAVRDYDAIAAVDPSEAVWVAPSDATGQAAVIQPLGDPNEDALQRVDISDTSARIKSYSDQSRIKDIKPPDTPGLTQIHTLSQLRNLLHTPELTD